MGAKFISLRSLLLFVLSICSFVLAKNGEVSLSYIQYQYCHYSEKTQKYCADDGEPFWEAGSVQLKITDDSLVTLNFKDKKFAFRYNRFREDVNSDGDSVAILTGQNKKGNKYMLVLGYDYFNLINSKKWGIYFLQEKKNKKTSNLKHMDFGTKTYSINSMGNCIFNEKTKKYEDNCRYTNFKEVLPIQIRTRMRRDNLYLSIDTLPEINITSAEESKTNDGVKVKFMSGVDDEGEDVFVVLGPTYFNLASNGEKINFSEKRYPDELIRPRIITGSGVAVTSDVIVTNTHVVEEMSSLRIFLDGKEVHTDSIELIGEMPKGVLDFAAIKIYGAKLNSCQIATKDPDLGSEVLVYGYPKIGVQGNDLKVTKGIVSGKNGFLGNKKMFQIDAAIQPGNSGGPIVSKGKVIGLATSAMVGEDFQNVNSGIKASKMIHLLRFFDVEPKASTNDYSKCTYLLFGEE